MNKQLAIEEFKSALFDKNEGSVQLDFLENRPLSDETIKFWDIGYCPPHVIYKPFPFLRGRIIIPLHDIYGNIVSFFGRKLDANTEEISKNFDEDYGEHSLDMFYKWCDSKWINEVYSKEKHLFGLYKNFDIISKQNYAILVEGCYDAIALWNFGAKMY
jgi:DNA primase